MFTYSISAFKIKLRDWLEFRESTYKTKPLHSFLKLKLFYKGKIFYFAFDGETLLSKSCLIKSDSFCL